MTNKYTTTPANKGEKTVLLIGWEVQAVFVGPNHAELAAKVEALLNQDAGELVEASAGEETP
jgi:hypothetical protein